MAQWRRRGPLLPTIVVLGILVAAFLVFTEIWTARLWFVSTGFPQVFSTLLLTQVILFFGFALVTAVAIGGNIWLAYRLRPLARRRGQSAVLDRYRDLMEVNPWRSILVPAVILGVLSGLQVLGRPMAYLAWWNKSEFGTRDPYFQLDISFYVFDFPILQELLTFALGTLFFSLLAATVAHFVVGGISPGRARAVTNAARIHLSIIAGLLLIGYGLQNLLDRYGMLLQPGTLFTGLHYTDDHARLTAKLVMAIIAFLCAGVFFANGFLKRWTIPVISLVLMLVSGLVLGLIYPMVIQSLQVRPNEPVLEAPYIEKHIEATRAAYGIDKVEIEPYTAETQVSTGQLKEDAEALPGIRLIDPAVVAPTFENQQQLRGWYTFPEYLDVDRYVIEGKETDAVVAAREIDYNNLPDQAWNNLHTVYTHGYGLVAAYGNQRSSSGDPVWIEKNLPPVGVLPDYEGRIYFGENTSTFAIVGREEDEAPIEFDTPDGDPNTYSGAGGVPMGDWFNRLLYSVHFGDLNILLSDRVNSQSQILYARTPKERVQQVAPWMTLDSNIYPAVVDHRLVWIIDGYTTSNNYPNSEGMSLGDAIADSQTPAPAGTQRLNYIRNSVKAVVDATDGTVSLYAWQPEDPILRAYDKAFPGVLKPTADISPDLMAHLRYPEDLFKVQRQKLARYHMTDPNDWYQKSDLWQVPNDPVASMPRQDSTTTTSGAATGQAEPPYYLSIKWPGDESALFSQTTVYVPYERQNLASYLAVVAEASSSDYGRLRVLRMSDTQQIAGPSQTANAMTTDPEFATLMRAFLNDGSAKAKYGNLLTLPVGGGLLYVMPVYVMRDDGNSGSYPALQYVAVRFGDKVEIAPTLQEALDQVFAGNAGASTGEEGDGSTAEPTDPDQPTEPAKPADPEAAVKSMQAADAAFAAAKKALDEGDLGEYQKQNQAAQDALNDALEQMGVS